MFHISEAIQWVMECYISWNFGHKFFNYTCHKNVCYKDIDRQISIVKSCIIHPKTYKSIIIGSLKFL